MQRFQKNNHCIFNISYHIIFVPKYRKSLLKGKIKNRIKIYLFEKARNLKKNRKI